MNRIGIEFTAALQRRQLLPGLADRRGVVEKIKRVFDTLLHHHVNDVVTEFNRAILGNLLHRKCRHRSGLAGSTVGGEMRMLYSSPMS
jgi:hypothetical protein